MFEFHGKFGWLQMFSDGEDSGGGTPAAEPAATPAPVAPTGPPTPTMVNPILQDNYVPGQQQAAAAPEVEPTPAAPVVEKLNFGGREVDVVHPVLKDLHRDYSELSRTFTQTSQQAKALETQNLQLQQMVQNMLQLQSQQAAQPAAPEVTGPTAEELEASKEAFMERFYDNPEAAIEERARKIAEQMLKTEINPVIEPIKQQQNLQGQVSALAQQYPDFQATIPQMRQLLSAAPHLEQTLSMEQVYLTAKSLMPAVASEAPAAAPEATPAAPVTPTTQAPIADPLEAAKAQLLADPAFKQKVFNEMLLSTQQQQAALPPVMGGQAGGSMPTMPVNKPTTLREGSKQALEYFKNLL